jgi:hypothetical protein
MMMVVVVVMMLLLLLLLLLLMMMMMIMITTITTTMMITNNLRSRTSSGLSARAHTASSSTAPSNRPQALPSQFPLPRRSGSVLVTSWRAAATSERSSPDAVTVHLSSAGVGKGTIVFHQGSNDDDDDDDDDDDLSLTVPVGTDVLPVEGDREEHPGPRDQYVLSHQ